MNPDPQTRAERGFHPGGAGAPAHAFRPKDLTFNFFTASLFESVPIGAIRTLVVHLTQSTSRMSLVGVAGLLSQ